MSRIFRRFLLLVAPVLLPLWAAAQPVPAFTASITTGCSPIVVNFTDASTGSPTSWLWDLGNGTTSTLQNPSTTYILPGVYTVSLTASNAAGSATSTMLGLITVTASPVVQFLASDTLPSCAPKTVSFTNLTAPMSLGLASYSWDFGDGTTSSLANPTHTYTSPGNYSVTLVATNLLGCTKVLTKTAYIKLVPPPVADFSASSTGACSAPLTTAFTNLTTGAVSYQWSFGDGGTSTAAAPTHIYTTPGAYTVTLIATNAGGCKDTIVKPAFVSIGSLDAALTPATATVCAGQPVSFSNVSTPGPGSSTWTWGDGSPVSTFTSGTHTYAAVGTYSVKLKVNYSGCADSAFGTVTVQPSPNAAAGVVNPTACSAPHTVSFTNSSTGATGYLWNFGDGGTSTAAAPSHTYTATGSYTVRIIAFGAGGCNDTVVLPSAVQIMPPAATITATPPGGCVPATVSFTTSTAVTGVVSYAWNFGDGATGTGATPSHTYSTPGTYTATCTFTTGGAAPCTFTASTTVQVDNKPDASFTATPTTVCVGEGVYFTNTSTGSTTAFQWIYGDGNTGWSPNPYYVYGGPGVYSVTLVAYNGYCSDTMSVPNMITVKNPLAAFSVAMASCTDRKTFNFTNASVGGTSRTWNFGDGTTSTALNPTHTYAANGSYPVTLTITDAATGCTSVRNVTVEVFDLDAQFNAPDTVVCRNEPVLFAAATNPNYASYSWDFGDGTTASVSNPSHPYTASGTYTVRLIVGDWYGCKDTLIRTAYIKVASPTVAFTAAPTGGCPGLTVSFVDASTPAAGFPITSRTWRFGDGTSFSSTTATTASHTYPASGSYSVTLVVYDASGCADSLTQPSYISVVKPVAAFAATDTMLCLGQATTFVNGTTGSSPAYEWNFGDGSPVSTAASPIHTYAVAGSYTVTLIATDAGGCKDTLVKPAYVNVVPNAVSFLMSDSLATCPPLNVSFTGTTAGASSYLWSFGDGTTSSLPNPSHLYTVADTFTVTLKVTNAAGCVDSASKTVTVLGPSGTLSYTPLNGCGPMSVTFSSTNQNTTSLTWDMNNGFTATTPGSSYSYTYTAPGVYIPVLILSNGAGCNVAVQGSDTLRVSSVLAGYVHTPTSGCGTATVSFTDTSYSPLSPITGWSWSFGDGGTSTLQNPTHTYTTAGTYAATLVATNSFGCSDTVAHTIVVNPKPNGVATTSGAVCIGSSASLLATGGLSYNWTPATGLSCTTCPNPSASPFSTTTYTVVITDAVGCTDTDAVTVTILPQPTVSIAAPASVCAGTATALAASGASTYTWSGSGVTGATGSSVTTSPASTATYTVVGASAAGCLDTAQATVSVMPTPVLTGGGTYNVCNGASLPLTVGGATTYTWSPPAGLSGTTGTTVTASPLSTTTYTVVGATGTCYDTATLTVNVTSTPVISAGPDQSMCPDGTVTLTGGGATTYVWSTLAGAAAGTGTSLTVVPTATTTYVVEGTAPGGCVGYDTVTVSLVAPPTVSAGLPANVCAGGSTTLTASGASTYTWSGAGLATTTGTSVTATPPGTTTYTVIGATGAAGCFDTAQVTVTVNPLPVVSIAGAPAVCLGASAMLTASGASTYTWTPSPTLTGSGASVTVIPTTTSVYTVTGTSAAGCVGAPASFTVAVNPLPVVTVAPLSPTICAGTTVALTASGAAGYTWTGTPLSASTGATVTASPASTTTYTVTGTSAAGCTSSTTTTVGVVTPPTVSIAAPAPICVGNTATLIATGATTYSWSPSTGLSGTTGSSVSATPLTTTTYTVIGTASGCSDTATQTVTVNPLPTITASAPVSTCPGVSATLTAGGGTGYLWSPATSLSCSTCVSPVANPTATTTYTVQGTDANGCSNVASVTVTKFPAPPVSAGPNVAVCSGLSATLSGSGALSYLWSPAAGLSCTTCASPVATPTAGTSYVLTGTDVNGCTATDTVVVSVGSLPTISAGPDQSACAGTPAVLTASGGLTYTWGPATGLSSTMGATVSATPASTTTYTVTGTNAAGCQGTDVVTVTVLPLPTVSAGADKSFCVGGSTTINASGAASYTWSPATGLSCTTCTTPTASPSSSTTYTLTGVGANGCTATDAVTVTVNALPSVNAGPDQEICAGALATLSASGAASYVWTPGGTLSCTACPSPMAAPTEPSTTYTVTGTDVNGCTATDSMVLRITPRAPMTQVLGDSVCKGESTTLTATGGMNYTWWPAAGLNSTNGPSVVATPEQTTTYGVAIKQNACYTDTAYATVVVNPVPTVDAGPDQSTWSGGTVELFVQSTDADGFRWKPAEYLSCAECPTPTAKPLRTTTFSVEAYNRFGCRAYDEVVVTVTCDASQVFVPNTFTPNGDGQNDRFYPRGKGIGEVRRFRIYNRWGELVYDVTNMNANDLVAGWDGTYKNQPLKPDVFVWVLDAYCESGDAIQLKGDISLIR